VPPLTYSTSFMSPGRPLAKPMVGGAPRARARAPGRGRPFRQRGSLCANVRHPEIIHPRTRAHRRGAPRPRYRHDPRPPAVRILRRRLRDPRRAVRWTPRYPPVRFRGSPLMSTSAAPPTDQQVASGNSKSRVIVASLIGTSIEFYDFYAYATAAVLVFPTVFFASDDPTYALLQSFAVFGVAFVARPVGSILFGHFGDRVGRKGTLVASLLTMGVATVLIGTLPPSSTPGWAVLSPALLVLMRFCQGLGLGGEWSGAALLATENAPEGKRAVWGTFPQLGAPIGFILANTVFLALAETLTDAQFLAWGWRVPFLASAVLVIVGLWVRLRLIETPAFRKVVEAEAVAQVPVARVFRTSWHQIVSGTFIMLATYVLFYLMTTFTLTYGTAPVDADPAGLGYARTDFLVMLIVGVVFFGAFTLASGPLAERFGRRAHLLWTTVAIIVFGLLFVPLFSGGTVGV